MLSETLFSFWIERQAHGPCERLIFLEQLTYRLPRVLPIGAVMVDKFTEQYFGVAADSDLVEWMLVLSESHVPPGFGNINWPVGDGSELFFEGHDPQLEVVQ